MYKHTRLHSPVLSFNVCMIFILDDYFEHPLQICDYAIKRIVTFYPRLSSKHTFEILFMMQDPYRVRRYFSVFWNMHRMISYKTSLRSIL